MNNSPEHIFPIINRIFDSIVIRDIMFSCEKLKNSVYAILDSEQYREVCLRVVIIKLSAGMLADIDRDLLRDIINRMTAEIDIIIERR